MNHFWKKNTTMAVFLFIIVTVAAIIFINKSGAVNVGKLADLIRSDDAEGVAHLIILHRDIVNESIDQHTKLKPIHLAASLGREMICSNLIAAHADLNAQEGGGETALYCALASTNSNILTMLLQHGANVNIADVDGKTPLYYAIAIENVDAVEILLQYGAEIKRENKSGQSILDLAKEIKNQTIINILSNHVNGITPLDTKRQP